MQIVEVITIKSYRNGRKEITEALLNYSGSGFQLESITTREKGENNESFIYLTFFKKVVDEKAIILENNSVYTLNSILKENNKKGFEIKETKILPNGEFLLMMKKVS